MLCTLTCVTCGTPPTIVLRSFLIMSWTIDYARQRQLELACVTLPVERTMRLEYPSLDLAFRYSYVKGDF